MNKQKMRDFLGALIALQEMLDKMSRTGFSWEKVQDVKDLLRSIIIDLERAVDG